MWKNGHGNLRTITPQFHVQWPVWSWGCNTLPLRRADTQQVEGGRDGERETYREETREEEMKEGTGHELSSQLVLLPPSQE